MTTYNTGNAIGSTDPRDLYDNAENLDRFANSDSLTQSTDRLGNSRKTLKGIEDEFDQFLADSGYLGTGSGGTIEDHAAGIEITAYNQIIRESGELYRLKASVSLPYTTSATWAGGDDADFVSVGDAALRQELADDDATPGSALVGDRGSTLDKLTLDDIEGLEFSPSAGFRATINAFWPGQGRGSGEWVYNPSRSKNDHNGGTVRSPTVPVSGNTLSQFLAGNGETDPGGSGCWERSFVGSATHLMFGAFADDSTDDTAAIQAAFFSGHSVCLPDGTESVFSSELLWLTDNSRIHGRGKLRGVGNSLGKGIRIVNSDNVWVDKIQIYSDTDYIGVAFVYGSEYDSIKTRALSVYNNALITSTNIDCTGFTGLEKGHNIEVKPGADATVRAVRIINNSVQGSGISSAVLSDSDGSDNIYVASYGIDSVFAPASEIIIQGNNCRYAGRQNCSIAGDPGNGPNHVVISGNTFRDSTFGGVDLEYGGRVSITGNSFINNGMSTHLINPDDAPATSIRAGISYASALGAEQSGNYSTCASNTFDNCYAGVNGYQQTISECVFINSPVTLGEFSRAATNMSNVTFIVDDDRPDITLVDIYNPNQSSKFQNLRIVDKVTDRTVEALKIRGDNGSTAIATIDGFTYESTGSTKSSALVTTNGSKLLIRGMTVKAYAHTLFDQVNSGGALEIQDSEIVADALTDGNANGDTSLVIINSHIVVGSLDSGNANPNDADSELRVVDTRLKMTDTSAGMTINRKVKITGCEIDLRGLTGTILNIYPQSEPRFPLFTADITENTFIMDGPGCRLLLINTAGAALYCVPNVRDNRLQCDHTPSVTSNIFNGKIASGVGTWYERNYYTNTSSSTVAAVP